MNLKEAFRYQKHFDSLLSQGELILQCGSNITRSTETYLRSKVKEEFQDETVDNSSSNPYVDKVNDIVLLLGDILEEKEKLHVAISKAKRSIPFDIDAAVAVNIKRQELAKVYGSMVETKPCEEIRRGMGTGYTFNKDGNQVAYMCDLKVVKQICFDRNMVRGKNRLLSELSDETSSKVDKAIVTTEVEYVSPYSINDTFEEILEAYTPV
ncbi:MAG: hypothetical protein KBS81_02505 [Spirochaetales bacterium]|nr:hypothetical protein [Candidatus Physcosoma equi]